MSYVNVKGIIQVCSCFPNVKPAFQTEFTISGIFQLMSILPHLKTPTKVVQSHRLLGSFDLSCGLALRR